MSTACTRIDPQEVAAVVLANVRRAMPANAPDDIDAAELFDALVSDELDRYPEKERDRIAVAINTRIGRGAGII